MSEKSLFSKIIDGEISGDIVYEDDDVVGLNDINPQAPVHVLFVPRREIETINDLGPNDAELVGKLFLAAKHVAQERGIAEEGYRTVMNCNAAGGQSVFHIHLHLLGGRTFSWPPG